MSKYNTFTIEEKNFIDEIIVKYVKKNFTISVTKIVTKKIKPKYIDFWEMPWEDLLMIDNCFQNNDIAGLLKITHGINQNQLKYVRIFNCFGVIKWIREQLDTIAEIEKNKFEDAKLSSEELEAGAEEFKELGYYNSLRAISKDLTKHNEILKLPYNIIFRELYTLHLENKVNKNMIENARRKNQRGN